MPSMTIRYEVDPVTGERTIVVSYQSDADALPMEHEEEHRELVEKLIEGGLVPASEAGKVRVEREPVGATPVEAPAQAPAEREALKRGS